MGNWMGTLAPRRLCIMSDIVKIGPDAVHLVDIGDPGCMVAVCLPPNSLRLGFYTPTGTEDSDGPIQHRMTARPLP